MAARHGDWGHRWHHDSECERCHGLEEPPEWHELPTLPQRLGVPHRNRRLIRARDHQPFPTGRHGIHGNRLFSGGRAQLYFRNPPVRSSQSLQWGNTKQFRVLHGDHLAIPAVCQQIRLERVCRRRLFAGSESWRRKRVFSGADLWLHSPLRPRIANCQ